MPRREVKHLTPATALRLIEVGTGCTVHLSTFYRWLQSGRVFSIRLGYRRFIPYEEVEKVVERSLAGSF
jgi:excisionase family DNA binding protein